MFSIFCFVFSKKNQYFYFFLFFCLFFSLVALASDVSSVVGAPWRCGVLPTEGGIAGIGLGHLLGREHDSTLQKGVEAPGPLKRSLARLSYCCCFGRWFTRHVCRSTACHDRQIGMIPVPCNLGVKLPATPAHPALDDQQLLVIEGPPTLNAGTRRPYGRSPKNTIVSR